MRRSISYILSIVSVFSVLSISIVSCYDVDVKVTKKRNIPRYNLEDFDLGSLDQNEIEKKILHHEDNHETNTTPVGTFYNPQPVSDYETDPNSDILLDIDSSSYEEVFDPNSSYTSTSAPNNSTNNPKYRCSNPYLPMFVEKLSLSEVKDLNVLINPICNNDKYYDFFKKDFGWRGDQNDKNSFVKILKQRKIDSTHFEFIVGMSFLLPKTEGVSYLKDIFKAYTDADWFQTHYVHPDNINIKLEKINRSLDEKTGFDISYTMIVNIMKIFKTSFKSNFISTPISNNFTVFTERSFDDSDSLMQRKHISFLNTEDKDFDHFVVFEYRILNTKLSQFASLAKSFMDTMDSNMMDAVYKNAELRKNSLQ